MTTVENNTEEPKRSISFVEQLIEEDLAEGKNGGRIQTRFPPEPNGYLHIGHAKAICMDFGVAEHYNGVCNLRFDDTNPSKENNEYVENILQDISWLGFKWGNIYYASDYFERLWDFALWMIRNGHAYVDEQTAEQIAEQKGTPTEPGTASPYRDRPVEESLRLFEQMNSPEAEEGSMVLRAKIDMAHPNMLFRDPIMYRILHAEHHRTGDKWCIYPMYDFAHPIQDAIEGITFSGDTLSADAPVIDFSFNVVRTAQVAYQLVYRRQGIWDFDQSTLIYDNNGDFGSYAIAGRTLSPGLKERSITLNTADAQSSGYVLLQILVIEKGLPSVVWSKVLCVPPTTGDPELRVHVQDTFCSESGEELTFVVYHGVPCELTVTIEDEAGQTVRRLSSRQASRPEQLSAPGSTFCWNGTDSQGKLVNAGLYRVRVKAYVGTERYEVESGWISLTEMVG